MLDEKEADPISGIFFKLILKWAVESGCMFVYIYSGIIFKLILKGAVESGCMFV